MRKTVLLSTLAVAIIASAGSYAFVNNKPQTAIVSAKIAEILTIHPDDLCRAPRPEVRAEMTSIEGDDELPIDIEITPALRLLDQHGERRNADNLFSEGLSLVFFGYASCEGVCLMAIPSIADAATMINEKTGAPSAKPILITIDPERDSQAFLKSQLSRFSDDFIGLTGPDSALQNARRMFNIQSNPVFEDAKGTVYQHGSFIFLVNDQAEVVSMLPPVLPPQQIAEIAMKYL